MPERKTIEAAMAAAARRDWPSAVASLRPLADTGSIEAQFQLGLLAMKDCDLISGREAFSLIRAAAERGHVDAMYRLATFPDFSRREGFQSPLSKADAWSWLLKSAEAGCVQAQYDAGAFLVTGDWGEGGVIAPDLPAAVEWYRRASEAGHAMAQFNLASMLLNGEGGAVDLDAAKYWLKRSRASGFAPARELLASLESSSDESE